MDRVSAWTKLCTVAGLFRQGTQTGGVPPTPIAAGWLNAVQEEIVSVILAAGIELTADDRSQLLKAIQHLVSESAKAFLPLTGGQLTGQLAALKGIRVPKGAPGAGNGSLVGYAFGQDGDSGLFAVGGSDGDGSDLALVIDGSELLRLKWSNGAMVLQHGLTLEGGASPYHTGNTAAMLAVVYPVGSVYMNMSSNQNPAVIFGFGTWVALAPGRVLLGAGSGTDSRGDAKAFAAGSTGGEYSHQLAVSEIPAHAHTTPQGTTVPAAGGSYQYASGDDVTTAAMGSPPLSGEAGGGQAHNNMQPYLVAYMWQRTV